MVKWVNMMCPLLQLPPVRSPALLPKHSVAMPPVTRLRMVNQYNDMKNYPEYFVDDPTLENGNMCIYIGTNHRHGSEFVLEYLYALMPMVWPVE